MNNRFLSALQRQRNSTQLQNPMLSGVLGITINGQLTVEVPTRNGYVYVQLRSSPDEVIQAFNDQVSPAYGLPVMVQWQDTRYIVVGRDTVRYTDWQSFSSYLPRHANTHQYDPDSIFGGGGDVVFVFQRQFMPLMPMPSGSQGNSSMVVNGYTLLTATGTFTKMQPQATVNLTQWNPSTPTGAIMVLVSMDSVGGVLHYDVGSGTLFSSAITGSAAVLPFVPIVSDISRYSPIAAVRLVQGTSFIGWDNIYDLRQIYGAQRTPFGQGLPPTLVANPLYAENQGTPLGTGTIFNFMGAGVVATISGTTVQVTVASAGGGGGTGSFLKLDTSNGPLTGPLVIYQQSPNTINQYFDRSTMVSFLSGTNDPNFAAAVEAVNWSSGIHAYGVYIDDEAGGAQSLYIGDQGRMDKTTFQIDEFIDFNKKAGTYSSPMVQWNRHGNNSTQYRFPLLVLNEADAAHVGATHQLEIDGNSVLVSHLSPLTSGSPLNYPFAVNAAYLFDTANTLPSGSPIGLWNSVGTNMEFSMPDGMHFFEGIGLFEHTGTAIYTNGQTLGRARLVNGTVTIPTKRTTSAARIFLTPQDASGAVISGFPYVYTRGPGSGFTVRSSSLSDNYDVAWLIIEPHIGQ